MPLDSINLWLVLADGMLLGLGLGVFCLTFCAPVITPVILGDHPGVKPSFVATLIYSGGRLVAYLSVGLILGVAGTLVGGLPFPPLLVFGIVLALGAFLIAYGFLNSFGADAFPRAGPRMCQAVAGRKHSLFVLGLLTGFSPCPPFLVAALFAITVLKSLLWSVLFFFMLWVGTTMLTLIWGTTSGAVGKAATSRSSPERVKRICGVMLVIVGCFFVFESLNFL